LRYIRLGVLVEIKFEGMNLLNDKLINKLKAASIHLVISFIIFLGILYYIVFEWYPEPFFTAQGGWQGIQLMAMVDLVLGPVLTMIVFNHLKKRKEIVLDLTLIAMVQVAALIWGGYSVYSQRPIALVFFENTFYTVTDDDYVSQGIAPPDFSKYSQHVPPLIYSRVPSDILELEQSRQLTQQSIPMYAQVMWYEKIEDNLQKMFINQLNIQEIIDKNDRMKSQLMAITKGDIAAYNYVELKAKYRNMILVMDSSGGIKGEVEAPYLN